MVSVDKAIIARIDIGGRHFEILVDPDLAWGLKEGRSVSVQDMLAINEVFSDAKKGMKASHSDVVSAFGTDDIAEIARKIVLSGELQLTARMMRELNERTRRKVAEIIHRNAVDPKTGKPHPVERILRAMEEARVRLDFNKSPESQVETAASAIKRIIPLSFEKCKLRLFIPVSEVGKVYGMVRGFSVLDEEWTSSGDLIVVIEVPAGMKVEVISKISSASKGEIDIKEV